MRLTHLCLSQRSNGQSRQCLLRSVHDDGRDAQDRADERDHIPETVEILSSFLDDQRNLVNDSVDGEKNEDEFEGIYKYAVATEMIVEAKHFDLMVLNERTHRCHFERKGNRNEEIDIGIVQREVNDQSTRQLIEPILGA